MKENIQNTTYVRAYLNDMKVPLGGGISRLSSRDLRAGAYRAPDEDELGKQQIR